MPEFSEPSWTADDTYLPDFGIAASRMLSQLLEDFVSFVIPLDEGVDQQELVMMVELGFFGLTGQRYQMVIPTQLNIEMVKKAALKFAHTMDEEHFLHPEYLVATMPYTQAKEWQTRLRDMDRNQRCADRVLLLSGSESCSINP